MIQMAERFRFRVDLNDSIVIDKLNQIKNAGFFKNDTELHREIYKIGIDELHERFFNPTEYYRKKAEVEKREETLDIMEFMFKDLTYVASSMQIIKDLVASIFNTKILELQNSEIDIDNLKLGMLTELPKVYQEMENLVEEKLTSRYEKLNKLRKGRTKDEE